MKLLDFSSPVDASSYVAGFGLAAGIALRGTNYETGTYRFSLVRPDDSIAPEVNGVTVADASEDTAAADIRAVIAATLP